MTGAKPLQVHITTKVTHASNGRARGGGAWTRGSLAHLLANRVYIGEVRHKDQHYPGEHDAIITSDLWEAVQARLSDRRDDRRSARNLRHGNLLGGLLYDGLGRPMRSCSAAKGSRTYHYYATCAEASARDAIPAWRMPAHELERLVSGCVQTFLGDGRQVHDAVAALALDTAVFSAIVVQAAARANDPAPTFRGLITRIDVQNDRVDVLMDVGSLMSSTEAPAAACVAPYLLSVAIIRVRRGKEVRLVIPAADGTPQQAADPALIKLLAAAFAARAAADTATSQPLVEVARAQGYSLDYFSLLLRLSMLAPDIVEAIHEGRQPLALNRQRLARMTKLPIEWAAQRTALGFS